MDNISKEINVNLESREQHFILNTAIFWNSVIIGYFPIILVHSKLTFFGANLNFKLYDQFIILFTGLKTVYCSHKSIGISSVEWSRKWLWWKQL